MPAPSSPIVVRLTPLGRGAVATLRVEGPGAVQRVERLFRAADRRPLAAHPAQRLVFGHIGPEPGEEVVVRRHGDGAVDLHCHGGHAAVAMLEGLFERAGCRAVPWQEWIDTHHPDPIAAAAHRALAEAPTQRTAAILLDQYRGALRGEFDRIEAELTRGDRPAAAERIAALLDRAELGRHLTRPWQAVLVGPPNVGKSSLVNALLGYARTIMDPLPGTTRDVVTAQTAIDGWPIELSDTAGWRQTDDAVERAGVDLARQRLAVADLVVAVFDASQPFAAAEREIVAAWPGALPVHNKCDLPPHADPRPPGLSTCALSGQRVDRLAAALVDRLVPRPPTAGAAVPFTDEQVDWLLECQRRAGRR